MNLERDISLGWVQNYIARICFDLNQIRYKDNILNIN